MSAHDAWLLTTGTQHSRHYSHPNHHHHPRTTYERTYWDRLAEPSIFVPFLVLVASILYSANILDFSVASSTALLPPALRQRLWDAAVSATPASLLFAVDEWLAVFPLPRAPFDRLAPAAAHEAKSSALARILGLDPGGRRSSGGSGGGGGGAVGLLASVSYAGKTGLSRLMPKGDIYRPAGLGNLSNSCYQNSILQSLASLAPLRTYLAKIAEEEDAGGLPPVQTAHTLDKLVRDLFGPTQNGETLWTPPVLKRMSTFQQQDAQEYFCKLLNEVQEEVEKALKAVQRKPGLESNLSLSLGLEAPSVLPLPLPLPQAQPSRPSRPNTTEPLSSSSSSSRNSLHSEDSGYHSISSSQASHAAALAASFRIPLEGLIAQRIVCQSCGYSSGLSMNPFYCLTLNPGLGSNACQLEETLDSFSAVENIEGVQCASCTLLKFRSRIQTIIGRFEEASGEGPAATRLKQPVPYERLEAVEAALEDEDFEEKTLSETCKIPDKQRVESTKSRQVGIARAPASIAFHINRSRFDETTGYTFKNPAAIRFPLRLDLGPWCLGSAASSGSAPPPSSEPADDEEELCDEEQWQLPAQLPMVAGSQHNPRLAGPLYELRAVITHYGQHENGHYVCYRKHPAVKQPRPEVEKARRESRESALHRPPNLASETASNSATTVDDEETLRATSEDPEDPAEEDAQTVVDDVTGDDADTDMAEPEEEAQWWRLSDQNVSRSDEATVLSQGGVFMLFYDRIDARSVFRPAGQHGADTPSSEDSAGSSETDPIETDDTEEDEGDDSSSPGPAKGEEAADVEGVSTDAASAASGTEGVPEVSAESVTEVDDDRPVDSPMPAAA